MRPGDQRSAAERHAPAEECSTCRQPVRRCRVMTEVTLYLDAVPDRKGSYVFQGRDRTAVEVPVGNLAGPKFRRHRCQLQYIYGPG